MRRSSRRPFSGPLAGEAAACGESSPALRREGLLRARPPRSGESRRRRGVPLRPSGRGRSGEAGGSGARLSPPAGTGTGTMSPPLAWKGALLERAAGAK